MSGNPVLIVDDEADLRNLLDLNLRREGFQTATARSGQEALDLALRLRPSVIILDLMLPDISGTEVCRRIRATPALAKVPVIMLTAKGEEIDRVVGFEVGADDYVVKSTFSARELVLRVRAILRRQEGATAAPEAEGPAPLDFGDLSLDLQAYRCFCAGVEVQLTATEFKLLQTLASRPGRVLTRGMLLEDVWDLPADLPTRTVDTHVKRLREKLGDSAWHLETVRGVGYRFILTPPAPGAPA